MQVTHFIYLQECLESNEMTGISTLVLLQVILVIILGRPECPSLFERSDNRSWPSPTFVDKINKLLSFLLLFIVGIEYGRSVCRPSVISLAIDGSGIMHAEKEI